MSEKLSDRARQVAQQMNVLTAEQWWQLYGHNFLTITSPLEEYAKYKLAAEKLIWEAETLTLRQELKDEFKSKIDATNLLNRTIVALRQERDTLQHTDDEVWDALGISDYDGEDCAAFFIGNLRRNLDSRQKQAREFLDRISELELRAEAAESSLSATLPLAEYVLTHGSHHNNQCYRGSDDGCHCGLDKLKLVAEAVLAATPQPETCSKCDKPKISEVSHTFSKGFCSCAPEAPKAPQTPESGNCNDVRTALGFAFCCQRETGHQGRHKHWTTNGVAATWEDADSERTPSAQTRQTEPPDHPAADHYDDARWLRTPMPQKEYPYEWLESRKSRAISEAAPTPSIHLSADEEGHAKSEAAEQSSQPPLDSVQWLEKKWKWNSPAAFEEITGRPGKALIFEAMDKYAEFVAASRKAQPQGFTICKQTAQVISSMIGYRPCALEVNHEGEHLPEGTCVRHGHYVGMKCPHWPTCVAGRAPSPSGQAEGSNDKA